MTKQDTLIPRIQLNAETVGRDHCFDAWRDAVNAVYEVEPLAEAPDNSECLMGWLLNGIVFSDVSFSPQSFRHCEKLSQDSNYLSLQIYRKGGCKGILAGEYWSAAPGEIHIFDFSREFYSKAEESNVVGVVIPHELIGYNPAIHPSHIRFSLNSPIGSYLADCFFSLFNQLENLDASEAMAISKGFCGMLEGLVLPNERVDPACQKNRKERMGDIRSYLNRNLSDPMLSADHLCRVFHISRPSLYRHFAEVGGVANYITQRRLDKACHQLMSTPASSGRVKDVASGLGFSDPSHFSRLFRQRFGMTPTEATFLERKAQTGKRQWSCGKKPINYGQLSDWLQAM